MIFLTNIDHIHSKYYIILNALNNIQSMVIYNWIAKWKYSLV